MAERYRSTQVDSFRPRIAVSLGDLLRMAMRKSPSVASRKSPLLYGLVVSFPGAEGLGGDGDSANCHLITAQGALLKSARERMNIISAYREVGSYRGAAELRGGTRAMIRTCG